jgi:hypothetical protein
VVTSDKNDNTIYLANIVHFSIFGRSYSHTQGVTVHVDTTNTNHNYIVTVQVGTETSFTSDDLQFLQQCTGDCIVSSPGGVEATLNSNNSLDITTPNTEGIYGKYRNAR